VCGAQAIWEIGLFLGSSYSHNLKLENGDDSAPFRSFFENRVIDDWLVTLSWEGELDAFYVPPRVRYLSKTFDEHRDIKFFDYTVIGILDKKRVVRSRPARQQYLMRRELLYALKAVLLYRIILGQTVEAFQGVNITRYWNIISNDVTCISCWVDILVEMAADTVHDSVLAILRIGKQQNDMLDRAIAWFWTGMALYLAFFVFYYWLLRKLYALVCSYVWPKAYVLKKKNELGLNRFVAKRETTTGVEYEFVLNGELVTVPAMPEEPKLRREEMALPGSDFYPSANKQVGCIMVATEDTELTIVGCFFRIGDYLITANHVANAVSAGVADVYLVHHKEGRRGTRNLDLTNVVKMDKGSFELEHNCIKGKEDAYATLLSQRMWSRIGISEVSVRLASQHNQMVSAVGFINGILMTSSGRTTEGGPVEIYHTASSLPGFSGSALYSGRCVVGMHVGADLNRNVAIRIEYIRFHLPRKNESNSTEGDEYEEFDRQDGRDYKREEHENFVTYYDQKSGRVKYEEWSDNESESDYDANKRSYMKNYGYRDESNPLPTPSGIIKLPNKKPVHCNTCPTVSKEADDYLTSHKDELGELGHDPSKYVWPVINKETEEKSVINHLKLYIERKGNATPVPVKIRKRAARLVVEKMQANRYEMPVNYKSTQNLERILNSSLIKMDRSPGHPYQEQGLMTNGAVLKHYGSGFVQIVQEKWESEEDLDLKIFLKGDPQKGAKIDADMPRIITGMPVHETVKDQAIFENFRQSMVANWKDSPVKYPFSPLLPGHIKHLADGFKGRSVYESDKPCWDFQCFDFVFEAITYVIQELAVPPEDATQELVDEYMKDVRDSINKKCSHAVYRCTNGKCFKSSLDGIMKSGSLFTIDGNSIGQLFVDYLIKSILGWTDEQILGEEIVVGGDDVLQTFPEDFDQATYLEVGRSLGFDLTEFKVNKSFDGCEFFSNIFTLREGVWNFTPARFTKHIEKLRTVPLKDLAGALSSHMMNHCWNAKIYNFFRKMYMHLRKDHPTEFPLKLVVTQRQLQYKVLGVETSC
jgi:hypothetical protein